MVTIVKDKKLCSLILALIKSCFVHQTPQNILSYQEQQTEMWKSETIIFFL